MHDILVALHECGRLRLCAGAARAVPLQSLRREYSSARDREPCEVAPCDAPRSLRDLHESAVRGVVGERSLPAEGGSRRFLVAAVEAVRDLRGVCHAMM